MRASKRPEPTGTIPAGLTAAGSQDEILAGGAGDEQSRRDGCSVLG
jgi:hypothetical protein